MRRLACWLAVFTILLLSTLVASAVVRAAERDFTIVTNQSSIAISGSVTNSTLGTTPIVQQGSGGLTTMYAGTIKTDRAGNSISFLTGSLIDANTSGNWTPLADATAGTSPADYGAKAAYLGGFATINFAGRNLLAGLVGTLTSIDGTGHFDLASTNVIFTSGDLAYRGPGGTPAGTNSLANQSGVLSGTGLLSSTNQSGQTTETLTLPVNATFNFATDSSATTTISLTLTGQLVATATFTAGLPGDYNQNGVVDAADYVVWRKNLGRTAPLPNDDSPFVGNDDYTRWQAHFGQSSSGSGAERVSDAVPEASTAVLFLVALVGVAGCGRNRS